MTSNKLISPMKFCYNTNSTLPKQCQSSRSVLQDGSRTFGLFWKEKTPSYNRRNTVTHSEAVLRGYMVHNKRSEIISNISNNCIHPQIFSSQQILSDYLCSNGGILVELPHLMWISHHFLLHGNQISTKLVVLSCEGGFNPDF